MHTPDPNNDIGVEFDVPTDLAREGDDTNMPHDDSPESLDEEIAQGANRESIDPDHSVDRPSVETIDQEENGVN